MPTAIITLAERDAAAIEARRRAVVALCEMLRREAPRFGGRFLLFGSAARGDMRPDSDVDLLLDFPDDTTPAAWTFAEMASAELNVRYDIRPVSLCDDRFLAHVLPHAVVLA